VTAVTARPRPPHVAVIGDGDPRGPEAHRILEWAEEVGQLLARGGAVVVTGGLGGVMRAASRGAQGVGGATIGILPGADAAEANEFVTIPIATGLTIGGLRVSKAWLIGQEYRHRAREGRIAE